MVKSKFTIGQMSKLHNIPIKTLRYYDEIDLFKPSEVDPANGYRYYSVEQFKQLDIIYYLKTLGVPLKEIKEQVTNKNTNDFLRTLNDHKEMTAKKIEELELINKRLEGRIQDLEATKEIKEIEVPTINRLKERKIVQLRGEIHSLYELEMSLRTLRKEFVQMSPIMIGKVGLTIAGDDVIKGNYGDFNSVFILLEDTDQLDIDHELVRILREGEYVSFYLRGSRSDAYKYYDKILSFIEEVNYEIEGNIMIRSIINQFITNDPSEYVTEILIPVKPLTVQ
jgi:DNA-binding transcriptional MerR regulator